MCDETTAGAGVGGLGSRQGRGKCCKYESCPRGLQTRQQDTAGVGSASPGVGQLAEALLMCVTYRVLIICNSYLYLHCAAGCSGRARGSHSGAAGSSSRRRRGGGGGGGCPCHDGGAVEGGQPAAHAAAELAALGECGAGAGLWGG
jgi:hypothetical protein